MSLTFPNAPVVGQTFTAEGRTFVWNGQVWLIKAEDIPWATLEEALAATSTDTIMAPDTMKALIQASEPPPPSYGPLTCRAWAVFSANAATIVASRNIASIVTSPEGQTAVVFQTPLPSADYLVHAFNRFSSWPMAVGLRVGVTPTINGFSMTHALAGGSGVVGTARSGSTGCVAVFL
jgi:hypothetical protein